MKAIIFTILLLVAALALEAQQALSVQKTESGDLVSFRFSKEINTAYYVIEGANDTVHFDIITSIKPQVYSRVPQVYQFTNYNDGYAFYMVKQIDMNGSCVASMKGKITKKVKPDLFGPQIIAEQTMQEK